jgi:hypothetical protein
MKRLLQLIALLVALSGIALWAARGANTGWTKTGKEVRTLDEVTGIEGITYEKGFWPGVDFLGGALIGAGVLAGGSLLIRNKPKTNNSNQIP